MIERVAEHHEWEVLDVDLSGADTEASSNLILLDGDRVTVHSLFDMRHNMVSIGGHVKHNGSFERSDSTRVSTLVARAELRPYDVYYVRANLFRRHADYRQEIIPIDLQAVLDGDQTKDLMLQDLDSLHIYSLADVGRDKLVHISGEVKRPGDFVLYENMTVQDLIFLAGLYTRAASRLEAELARVDSVGDVSLTEIALNESSLTATSLAEGDRLYIRRIPEWRMHRIVFLEGEVRYPGEYVLSSTDETLYALLQRAGGFTQMAFPDGLVLERRSIGATLERMHIPKQVERSNPIVRDSLGHSKREALFTYDSESLNRIILDVDRLLSSGGRQGDVVLEPGDHITVPSVPSGVSVMGAVAANGTIKHTEKKPVKFYVKRAGDFTPGADKKNTRLVKANGMVFAGSGVLSKRVEIGDVIVVPSRIKKDRDWSKTLTTMIAATTSALTTILIIDKL
jgi:protein involved in polysaccharide export with SLBB domain